MNINRDKHNKYVAGWTPNITTSTGSETSNGSTSTIIYVGGGGSSSGGDSGTVTQQNTFLYYVMSDGTNSITQTATIPTDTAILTLIGKNGVTVTASQEKSIPETEFVSTGTNTGTYKISYNKLVTTPDPTEEVPKPQPITTYPVTITYVSGDKILTSSFDTLTLYNTVDETEQVVATYNQTQLQIDGDTTGINSIVADANNTVFSRITLSITVEEQSTIVLDFAVTVNQQDILYVEGTQTEQYWKLDDNGNLYTTYNAYSTQELSAYGIGESEGTPTTGAEYLYQLKDVSDAVQTPIDKGILQYNAATSQWEVTDGSNITPDLTGYAKENWVTQQITNQINILKGNAPENMDTLGEIAGVISSLSDKVTSLEVLLEWFEWDDANDAIKALFDLYGVGEISAYGYNTQEQPVGAQYLNDLLDVTVSNPTNNQILIYNGSQWVNQVLPESGLNESELAQYLTEHNYVQSSALKQYATITQLNQEITNLIGGAPAELDTLGEIATVIQSLQQLLDWFSFVDGRIRANYDLWGVGEISAYGVGEGSSSGGKNYLRELEDVLLGDDLASGQLLQYNGTYWVNIDKDEVGLNETELANYLTQNNYLQQGDVTWSNLSGKPSTFNTTINQINDLNSSWDSLLLNPPTDYVTRWPAFSEVTDKPTTLAGYGITDAYTKTETDDRYVNITGDTMTGALTTPQVKFNNTYDTRIGAGYSSSYGDYIELNVNGASGVDATLRIGNVGGHFTFNGQNVLHEGNYTDYTVTKTGGGASGTWGIGITGNAGSATKLQTARTLWGQSFDGTANVSGSLSSVTNITMSGYLKAEGIVDSLNFVMGKTLTSISNFQQDVFGTTAWSYKLTAIRWDGTDSTYGARWSPMIAVATNDTSGFITFSSSSADTCYIGGGGSSSLVWRAKLFNDSMNLIPKNNTYSIGSASVRWYEIYASRFIANGFLQVGNGRIYYDSTNNALYVQKSDGSACGFYATGEVSAYGTNDDVGGYYVQKSGDTMTGRLTISTSDNQQLYLNGTSQAQIAFRVNGTTQSLVGYSNTSGAFLQIGSHWINMRSDGTACVDNEHTIWHSGNDGSGSGLDADLLDGTHKSGLFSAMTYSGSTLSITIGGTRKTATINASGGGASSVSVSSSSSRNISVTVDGHTDYVNSLYATYLGGTTKQGLFTGLTYSSNKLSVTIGGTTKSVTINAASGSPSVSLSSTSSTDLTVNVGGNSRSIPEMFASHLRPHYGTGNVPNIDNITYCGLYNWGGSTSGTKPSSGYGLLLHLSNYAEKPSTMSWCWRAQLGFGTDGHLFFRISVNGSAWGAWKTII